MMLMILLYLKWKFYSDFSNVTVEPTFIVYDILEARSFPFSNTNPWGSLHNFIQRKPYVNHAMQNFFKLSIPFERYLAGVKTWVRNSILLGCGIESTDINLLTELLLITYIWSYDLIPCLVTNITYTTSSK